MVASKAARRSAPYHKRQPRKPTQKPPPPAPRNSDQFFLLFPKLPVELRHQIWHWAAEIRPRVIQIFYDPDAEDWQACKDGRGGLPPTRGVSREARKEALKEYTTIFGTYFQPQMDTILISDPIFSLRKQRSLLLGMECTKRVKNVAFTGDVYHGLEDSKWEYPALCESPAAILRKFDQVEHFSLVLLEDGLDVGRAFDENELLLFEDSDDDFQESEDGNSGEERNSEVVPEELQQQAEEHDTDTLEDNDQLNLLDEEAFEAMTRRGYFRHTGNIHFESVYYSDSLWDSFDLYRETLVKAFKKEKKRHPDFVRPRFSIVEVKYGLNLPGDDQGCLHDNGDHEPWDLEHNAEAEEPSNEESSEDDAEADSSGGDAGSDESH